VEKEDLETLKNTDRFEITENGLSKRWLPGESDAYYFANGDEHNAEGILDEEESAGDMYAKRMRKLEFAAQSMPEPVVHGEAKNADISFVGWGSTKGPLVDAINDAKAKGLTVNYLHYSYMWPLKTDALNTFFKENSNVHLAEGNYTGQLGNLIEQQTTNRFKGRLVKWNGRPFFTEDLEKYINDNK
jgi:2-oxoglutarate ferredoxin oxidoreductase subunit alpha